LAFSPQLDVLTIPQGAQSDISPTAHEVANPTDILTRATARTLLNNSIPKLTTLPFMHHALVFDTLAQDLEVSAHPPLATMGHEAHRLTCINVKTDAALLFVQIRQIFTE